ncbi:unnamed protein product [Clonostachys rosea f. rosea IK726]|uniref:Uncharacterized protein n=1 Tax=Clonostachys rosea f. rosea IK726 TaxID=1349383 RepID=A0ACA9U1H9_BIOOC|nr:unnamed protein product [Clonostachys rosea f. rosea IK726]
MGKIFLVPGQQDLVKLDEKGTHLVFGNIAGIRSSIVNWIVERGAKNIVIASCSAESHSAVLTLIQSAADKSCNYISRNCDISSEDSVIELADYCCEQVVVDGYHTSYPARLDGQHVTSPSYNFFLL